MRNGNSAHLNLKTIDGALRILIQAQGFHYIVCGLKVNITVPAYFGMSSQ